jgi:hypothetical protein
LSPCPGSPAQETAPGNFLLPGDDHISIGVSSTNAFALVFAILRRRCRRRAAATACPPLGGPATKVS